jgi:hypothetical protein
LRSTALLLALCAALALGCNTVTMRTEGTTKLGGAPTWQERQNFFWWGLSGEGHVDVPKVCTSEKAAQMQTQDTFGDIVLGFFTLGIYAPRTAKVWCE